MPREVLIQVVPPSTTTTLQPDLVAIYRHAFRRPPYRKGPAEAEAFAHFLPLHAAQAGFRLVLARDADTQQALGFAYGRDVDPAHPWHEVVAGPLRAAGLGEWLLDAYHFSEMAVLPAAQRQGIGSRLHDRLLQDLPHKRALLTTMAAAWPASRLYARKGWRILLPQLPVPGLPRTYRVMGLALPLPQPF